MGEWSTDTRDLVAATIAAHVDVLNPHPDGQENHAVLTCSGCDFTEELVPDDFWYTPSESFRAHRADAVLTALTEAGALPPAGGQKGGGDWRIVYGVGVEIVWATRLTAKEADRSLANALHSWPSARKQCRATTSWPDGSVYYGPWREVTDA